MSQTTQYNLLKNLNYPLPLSNHRTFPAVLPRFPNTYNTISTRNTVNQLCEPSISSVSSALTKPNSQRTATTFYPNENNSGETQPHTLSPLPIQHVSLNQLPFLNGLPVNSVLSAVKTPNSTIITSVVQVAVPNSATHQPLPLQTPLQDDQRLYIGQLKLQNIINSIIEKTYHMTGFTKWSTLWDECSTDYFVGFSEQRKDFIKQEVFRFLSSKMPAQFFKDMQGQCLVAPYKIALMKLRGSSMHPRSESNIKVETAPTQTKTELKQQTQHSMERKVLIEDDDVVEIPKPEPTRLASKRKAESCSYSTNNKVPRNCNTQKRG